MSWASTTSATSDKPASTTPGAVIIAVETAENSDAIMPRSRTTAAGAANITQTPWPQRVLRVCVLAAIGSSLGLIRIRSSVFGDVLCHTAHGRAWMECNNNDGGTKQIYRQRNSVEKGEGHLAEYECVWWHATDESPSESYKTRSCSETIVVRSRSPSGFCEIRHPRAGDTKRVMVTYLENTSPSSHAPETSFTCDQFQKYLGFGRQAELFVYDQGFSYGKCRQELLSSNNRAARRKNFASARSIPFRRGISLIGGDIADGAWLQRVGASIESLRSRGCSLPIELWYNPHDTEMPTLAQALSTKHGVFLRELEDMIHFSGRYAKMYAAFYSAFDQVLVIDTAAEGINTAATTTNPTYLFASPEFASTGAIFWRRDDKSDSQQPTKTTLSLMHEVFDVDLADLQDQAQGSVLIDRRRNLKALNVLMYYAVHREQIASLHLMDEGRNAFQLAWRKAESPFHLLPNASD
ncbi:Rxlr-like protein, partial [Globisporangium splendens]